MHNYTFFNWIGIILIVLSIIGLFVVLIDAELRAKTGGFIVKMNPWKKGGSHLATAAGAGATPTTGAHGETSSDAGHGHGTETKKRPDQIAWRWIGIIIFVCFAWIVLTHWAFPTTSQEIDHHMKRKYPQLYERKTLVTDKMIDQVPDSLLFVDAGVWSGWVEIKKVDEFHTYIANGETVDVEIKEADGRTSMHTGLTNTKRFKTDLSPGKKMRWFCKHKTAISIFQYRRS